MSNTISLEQFSKERLTPEQERALAARIKWGDEGALVELVMASMREAMLYSQRVSYGRIDDETRLSLCYQEMCMSARRFTPGKTRYFAFAKAGLRGRMKTYWSSLNTVRNASEYVRVDALESTHPQVSGLSPSLGGKPSCAEDDHEVSFREAVTGEVVTPDLEPMLAKDHWQTIRRTFESLLSEQQWMILDLHYLGGLNHAESGKLLGLTRSGIQRSHEKAIKKLRDAVREHKGLLL